MLELIRINNPLDRSDQQRISLTCAPGLTLETVVREATATLPAIRNTHLAVSVSGALYRPEQWPQVRLLPGQQIIIIPVIGGGGKDLLRSIAMITIAVAAMVYAPGLGAAMGDALFSATSIGLSVNLTTGIMGGMMMMAGSMLVNAVLPPVKPQTAALNGASALEQSNVYSWNPQTTQQQGTVIPVAYGICPLDGNVIGAYRENDGDKQYLNLLISLGEGPLADIYDIEINGQPIDNYPDISIETRLGLLNQEPIPFFADTVVEHALSLVVTQATPVVYAVPGSDYDALQIELAFVNGLGRYDDYGDLVAYSCSFQVQYAPHNSTAWITLADVTATEAVSSIKRFTWRVDNLAHQLYDVRIVRTTEESDEVRILDDLHLSAVREIIYDDFEYPCEALVGIKGLATEKLSGSFSFRCKTHGKLVRVYRDDAWHTEVSHSPAWLSFDALTRPIFDNAGTPVYYRGYDPAVPLLAHYRELSDYNATQVSNGFGGLEDLLTWNGLFDSQQTMWDAALNILATGRATPYWMGNQIRLAIDKPVNPSAMFTVGNIIADSFSETWLSMDNRAGRVEVDYLNADRNLARDKMTVVNHLAPATWGTARVPMQGCISTSECIRRCRYHLNTTQLLTRSGSFTADVDALPVVLGSVINVQHDVMEVGKGGRLLAATDTTVTLDQLLEDLDPYATWQLDLATPDGMVTRTMIDHQPVTINGAQYSQLTLDSPFDPIPAAYTVYAFGTPSTITKPWRVVDITPAGDLRQVLGLAEYNSNVWNGDYSLPTLPTPSYSTAVLLPPVQDLAVSERLVKRSDGTIDDLLIVSFTPPLSGPFARCAIWISADGTSPQHVADSTTGTDLKITCKEGVEYRIYARTVNIAGSMTGLEASPQVVITTVGKAALPGNCSTLLAAITRQGVTCSWTGVTDVDLDFYRLKLTAVWTVGGALEQTIDTSSGPHLLPVGTNTLMVKAVDTTGHESAVPASTQVTIAAPNAPLVTHTVVGGDCIVSWSDATSSYALRQYELRYGDDWHTAEQIAIVNAQTIKLPVTWSGSRRIMVAATDINNQIGEPGVTVVGIAVPGQVVLSARTVDNLVLLSWTASASQLPIAHYLVQRGADVIGTLSGRFTTWFESAAGNIVFTVTPVDSAGNPGIPATITVNVTAPPSYALLYDYDTSFSLGTKTNCLASAGHLLAPVNTSESFAAHFTSNSWDSPQDQIDAGYPGYLQPTPLAASYEETIDYGMVIDSTMVTLAMTAATVSGAVTVTPTISVKKLLTDTWTDHADVWQIFAADFQYIKIRLDFSGSSATALLDISRLNLLLSMKEITDGGRVYLNAADVDGTWIPFNKAFLDVQSITHGVEGSTPLLLGHTLEDVPNPAGFRMFAWTTAGARASGWISWGAKGV